MQNVGTYIEFAMKQLSEDATDELLIDMELDWINVVKDTIIRHRNGQWRWLEDWGTLSIGSSGVTYLPDYVHEVVSMYPSTFAYRRPTFEIGARQFDEAGPGVSAGLVDYHVPWATYGVLADPAIAGVITATSSTTGGGDAGMQLTIVGRTDDTPGYEQSETITLVSDPGGDTASTTLTFADAAGGVRDVYILNSTRSGLTQGIITITDANGTVLQRINSATEIKKEHKRMELYPTSNGPNFVMRFYRRVRDVASEDAVLEIPREFSSAMYHGMKWQIADFQGDINASGLYYAQMQQELKSMLFWDVKRPGRRRGFVPNQSYRNRNWRF